jgi:peptide/nickel transport system permease protein
MSDAPATAAKAKKEETFNESWYTASQGQLIWWRFRKHKVAVVSMWALAVLYFVAILADFFAPYERDHRFTGLENSPPTAVRIAAPGKGLQAPFVYGKTRTVNRQTFKVDFAEDTERVYRVKFFVEGDDCKLLGLFRANLHFFGTDGDMPVLLFGTDRLGRDLFSRTLYGARISLFIGFGGVFLSFVLGCTLGGISGYFGGVIDDVIQRTIEVLLSMPTIPLWMALAAAIPRMWSVTQTYFAITLVLAVVGWAGLARIIRGKLLALRQDDFVLAARISGSSQTWIITRHLLPNFLSYLIVHITLAIPSTILGETSLSFLGLGMQPPAVSWGVLLRDAQDIGAVAQRPWQLIPGLFVVLAVLMFSFIGDGLRDAADPYR